ncbi:MAG: LPS export ABC transporter periplasmic protein LptC [Candidatus Marinimicrobia bacterium]|nr:LPS export ABC transporter periplasmic protein LptC [Candidatus Neomarinimicrobiota bacterium]
MKKSNSVYFIIFLISCETIENNESLGKRSDFPDQESWKPIIVMTREAKKRAIVRSDYLAKNSKNQETVLNGNVDVDFYSEDEEHMSNLRSESAFVYEDNDNLLAIGNVIVESDSGVTLFTDSLFWDNETEKINSNDTVMLATELNDTLYGIGFESDVDLTRWKILKPWGVSSREE